MKTGADQKVGVAEACVLQAILTSERVDDSDMTSSPLRSDRLSTNSTGSGATRLLSAESYECNCGAYLHRVYLRREAEQSGLAKMLGRLMDRSRKKIVHRARHGEEAHREPGKEASVREDVIVAAPVSIAGEAHQLAASVHITCGNDVGSPGVGVPGRACAVYRLALLSHELEGDSPRALVW
jgi:hypothetical protein